MEEQEYGSRNQGTASWALGCVVLCQALLPLSRMELDSWPDQSVLRSKGLADSHLTELIFINSLVKMQHPQTHRLQTEETGLGHLGG